MKFKIKGVFKIHHASTISSFYKVVKVIFARLLRNVHEITSRNHVSWDVYYALSQTSWGIHNCVNPPAVQILNFMKARVTMPKFLLLAHALRNTV